MQDEEIPSNQTFAEAVEYMRDKVETWRREIIASSDQHVSAVLNLRRYGHNASAEERKSIHNAFLEKYSPVVINTFHNIDLAWCTHSHLLLLKAIDRKRTNVSDHSPVRGINLYYCGSAHTHGDVYVGFHKSAIVVETYNNDTRLQLRIFDLAEVAALDPWDTAGFGLFILIGLTLNEFALDKTITPTIPDITKE